MPPTPIRKCRLKATSAKIRTSVATLRDRRRRSAAAAQRRPATSAIAGRGRTPRSAAPRIAAACARRPLGPAEQALGRTRPAPRAISRNTSTSVIFGKTRMPKACSWPMMSAARKAPGTDAHAADHGDDEGLGDDVEVHVRIGRRFGICSAPPSPARNAPRNSVPVNSSAWLTPSAPTISRSCVAARTSTPKRVLCRSSHKQARAPPGPRRSGTARRTESAGRGSRPARAGPARAARGCPAARTA